jgi:hypothetical protein
MMGSWSLAVNILFPFPFLALVLLSLPLPAFASPLKKFIIKVIDKVLFTKIFLSFNLYQLAILLSTILFGLSLNETVNISAKLKKSDVYRGEALNCLRFRFERNFWISLFSLVLWLILYEVQSLSIELQRFRDEAIVKKHKE